MLNAFKNNSKYFFGGPWRLQKFSLMNIFEGPMKLLSCVFLEIFFGKTFETLKT